MAITLLCAHAALAESSPPASDGVAGECTSDAVSSEALRQLLLELRAKKAGLEQRERDLEQRERVSDELARDTERVLAEIEAIRDAVETRLDVLDQQSGSRIARLAKVYAEMPPAQVAPLLEQLDLDLATAILSKMKHKKSAAVMAQLSESSALGVSNRAARPLEGAVASDSRTAGRKP
jgi:flagellar motility protein MotE (MotC chaperone)